MANSSIITGIDIGTETTRILVVQKKKEETGLEVLAQIEKPLSGIRKGVVVDVEGFSNQVRKCLDEIQELISQKISLVYVNIGGSHISCSSSHGEIAVSRADRKISQEDIERVVQAAQAIDLPSNREILEAFPREFIIDKEKGIKEPSGMTGIRLEVELLLLIVFSPYLKNLTKAILNSDVQIGDIQTSPLAVQRAVLTPRQKELGVALIDIGAGTTGLSVFEEGDLIHSAVFPIGSANITNDIAIGLKCDIDIAERIKREFGSCLPLPKLSNEIKIPNDSDPFVFRRKRLTEIIEARVSQIFEQVNKELKKVSRQKLLPAGIVLTGGGAKLPKIMELAKKELGLPVKKGVVTGFSNLREDSSLATVCGLVLRGVEIEEGETESGRRQLNGIFSKIKKLFKVFIP